MRLLVALTFILAGCVESIPPEPEEAPLLDLGAETCAGVFFARLPDFEETDKWLPPGFEPTDASTVLTETGTSLNPVGKAFMGAFAARCETYWFNNYWIAVEPPSLADQEGLHWYELAAYFDDAPITLGLHGADLYEMNASLVQAPFATVYRGTDDHDILRLTAAGVAPVFSLDRELNFWQITDSGTLVLEGFVVVDAMSGDASCESSYPWIEEFSANCAGDDVVSGTLPTLEFGGTYRFFEGQFPT